MNVYWNILLTLEFQILIKSHLISWLLSCHVSHLKCSQSAWSTSASTSDAVGLEGGQIPYLVALMLMASGHLRRRRRFAKVHNYSRESPSGGEWAWPRGRGIQLGTSKGCWKHVILLQQPSGVHDDVAHRHTPDCLWECLFVCVWQQHVVVHGPHAQLTVHTITRQIIKYVQRQCNVQVVSPSHSFWRLVAKYLHCN